MKQVVKKFFSIISGVGVIFQKLLKPSKSFAGSRNYWEKRYNKGRNSGDGSYGVLAEFKAEIINDFVLDEDIKTVMEYGCGDGNQLRLAEYPGYTGLDVSSKAVSICRETFINDKNKVFKNIDDYSDETAELTLSLDVIYHLVEDDVFNEYMQRLFNSATRFVIIYASDTEANQEGQAGHVRHRRFTKWVEDMQPDWRLFKQIPNKYPYNQETGVGSLADFFIYDKT